MARDHRGEGQEKGLKWELGLGQYPMRQGWECPGIWHNVISTAVSTKFTSKCGKKQCEAPRLSCHYTACMYVKEAVAESVLVKDWSIYSQWTLNTWTQPSEQTCLDKKELLGFGAHHIGCRAVVAAEVIVGDGCNLRDKKGQVNKKSVTIRNRMDERGTWMWIIGFVPFSSLSGQKPVCRFPLQEPSLVHYHRIEHSVLNNVSTIITADSHLQENQLLSIHHSAHRAHWNCAFLIHETQRNDSDV